MSSRIEDYALIGDCQTAALVSKTAQSTGSVGPASIRGRASPRCWVTRAMAVGGSRQPSRARRGACDRGAATSAAR